MREQGPGPGAQRKIGSALGLWTLVGVGERHYRVTGLFSRARPSRRRDALGRMRDGFDTARPRGHTKWGGEHGRDLDLMIIYHATPVWPWRGSSDRHNPQRSKSIRPLLAPPFPFPALCFWTATLTDFDLAASHGSCSTHARASLSARAPPQRHRCASLSLRAPQPHAPHVLSCSLRGLCALLTAPRAWAGSPAKYGARS